MQVLKFVPQITQKNGTLKTYPFIFSGFKKLKYSYYFCIAFHSGSFPEFWMNFFSGPDIFNLLW